MGEKAAFKQSDVTRLIKGALKAGVPVGSFQVVVDKGRLTLLPIEGAPASPSDPLDAELTEWAARHGYG